MSNGSYEITDRRPIAETLRRLANRPVRWCTSRDVHPNTISYLSTLASTVAGFCFVYSANNSFLLLVGVFFCFVRLYCNMLDGMVAIAGDKACASGEIANELPDRFSDILIFVGIAHSGLCHMLLGYWAVIISLLVAYVGTLGKASGAHRDFSGPMSKPWRVVALGSGAIGQHFVGRVSLATIGDVSISMLDVACMAVIGGGIVTIVTRLNRIVENLNQQQTELLHGEGN